MPRQHPAPLVLVSTKLAPPRPLPSTKRDVPFMNGVAKLAAAPCMQGPFFVGRFGLSGCGTNLGADGVLPRRAAAFHPLAATTPTVAHEKEREFFRVGSLSFLDFVSSSARTMHPHGAYTQVSGRNRIGPHQGSIQLNRPRRVLSARLAHCLGGLPARVQHPFPRLARDAPGALSVCLSRA